METDKRKRMQEILDGAVADGEIAGGSFCMWKDGRELCYFQSGYADLGRKIPVERDSIFRLYSMTKPVTAAAVMKLMEDGLLDIGAPVSSVFPSFSGQVVIGKDGERIPVKREVTVRDLLDMTAGLLYPGHGGTAGKETDRLFLELDRRLLSDHPMTTEELADGLGHCPLAFQPGSSWQYSSCADVLGAVVERVSGISFSEYLQEFLFGPLGMADTDFHVPEEKRGRLAVVYQDAGSGLEPYTGNHLGILNTMDRKPAFESGGAGLVSTVDDYMRFVGMLLQGGKYGTQRILSEKTVRFLTGGGLSGNRQAEFERQFSQLAGFTYGNLMRVRRGEGMAYHLGSVGEYGWDGWLGCYFANDPQERTSLVFMTQKKAAGTLGVLRKLKNVGMSSS